MSCCFCIHTSEIGIVEDMGKFSATMEPGCHCISITKSLSGRLSLRINILNITVDSKTSDNALVRVKASVHYRVKADRVQEAFYRFSNPAMQIQSFAGNVIRGQVPKHSVDEIFTLRDEMQKALMDELEERLATYGFEIISTLITDIDPSNDVKHAMSQIQTNARLREAASYEADTDKIKMVKAAEADAEAKRLSGVGLAEQRKAAIMGLQTSVCSFSENVNDVSDKDIMALLMMNQYFDAIKDIASTGHNQTVFLPTTSAGTQEATQGMLAAMSAGGGRR